MATILLAGALTACSSPPGLVLVESLPYERSSPPNWEEFPTDNDGVRLYERDGIRHRHPVAQTQFAVMLLESWRSTGDEDYLNQAELNATDLLAHANGDYLPYTFDFPLHGDPSNTIHAPWYSAMAQGQFLSLSVRLAEATDDAFWRNTADRFFLTLDEETDFSTMNPSPWVTFRDDNGYLWFEEYAGDVIPMRVLNGHIFAMYGLYDYWRFTGSEEAAQLFEEGARTVEHYVPFLRVDGEPSWYGMRIRDNPVAQSERYHRIHIEQLRMLARMTDNDTFDDYASLLENDFS